MLEKYLYRAKCSEGTSAGNWVKGYVVPDADGEKCQMKFYKDGDDYLYTCYVAPDTVGRCTGVRDNKGTWATTLRSWRVQNEQANRRTHHGL